MNIIPGFGSVKEYFKSDFRYYIPIYQRGYAWKDDEISDFVRDYKFCFNSRKQGVPRAHFFGAIVSIQSLVVGSVGKQKFELIDGQQRMATFVLMASILKQKAESLRDECIASKDSSFVAVLQEIITDLANRYIEFNETISGNTTVVRVLTMSKMDNQHYADLIRGTIQVSERSSHKNLNFINEELIKCIEEITGISDTGIALSSRIDNLDKAIKTLEEDFKLLVMNTYNRKEAYKLFQVLNDRGRNLSEGDLLRAKTLELLEGHASLQSTVEGRWDDILADEPNTTKLYLKSIYSSYNGKNSGAQSLYDDFLISFFPDHEKENLNLTEATGVMSMVEDIYNDILKLRVLSAGSWPYQFRQPISVWHRDRLNLLIVQLGHTLALPLLLSASKLDHRKFAKIVASLERFIFRYKMICNQHVGKVSKIYLEESVNIRSNVTSYDLNDLKSRLQTLITTNANDTSFTNGIATLNYIRGGNNKKIKYFLMALEYYYDWYSRGAVGIPECRNTTMVYSFGSTTIEHIYPYSAKVGETNSQLEQLKNTIGNLSFMGPEANGEGGNNKFLDKIDTFKNSTVKMNVAIGGFTDWNLTEYNNRKGEINTMACKVFIP